MVERSAKQKIGPEMNRRRLRAGDSFGVSPEDDRTGRISLKRGKQRLPPDNLSQPRIVPDANKLASASREVTFDELRRVELHTLAGILRCDGNTPPPVEEREATNKPIEASLPDAITSDGKDKETKMANHHLGESKQEKKPARNRPRGESARNWRARSGMIVGY
jgi:hypothetical protein